MAATRASATTVAAEWSLAVVAAELATVYVLSTLPTPLYPIYQAEFGFSQLILTLIFAAYVVGTASAMFLLGRLSDQIGRRPVVMVALGLAAASTLMFLAASSTAWLFVARIASGLAIALAAGATTAWLIELEPHGDQARATRLAIGANVLGLGIGPLLAGLLAQFAPHPLALPYLTYLVMLLPIPVLLWRVPETLCKERVPKLSLRPRLGVPRELLAPFTAPALAAVANFAVFGFYAGLIPTMLSNALHTPDHAVAGAVVAWLCFVGVAVIAATNFSNRVGIQLALLLLLPALLLLVAAHAAHSLVVLVAATTVTGVASGLGYVHGTRVVNGLAPDDKRAEIVSTYQVFCFAGLALPVIGVALLSQAMSPLAAESVFAGVTGALVLVAFAFVRMNPPNA
jgi:MFS family permease